VLCGFRQLQSGSEQNATGNPDSLSMPQVHEDSSNEPDGSPQLLAQGSYPPLVVPEAAVQQNTRENDLG